MSGKRLVLEIDKATHYAGKPLRANMSVLDEDGSGHGYRMFGPKFDGIPGKVVKNYTLDERDRNELRRLLAEVDGPLTASDEAIEAAVQAACAAIPSIEEDDPDNYLTWDETPEDERAKMRQMARVIIEAALPLLKYEVQP